MEFILYIIVIAGIAIFFYLKPMNRSVKNSEINLDFDKNLSEIEALKLVIRLWELEEEMGRGLTTINSSIANVANKNFQKFKSLGPQISALTKKLQQCIPQIKVPQIKKLSEDQIPYFLALGKSLSLAPKIDDTSPLLMQEHHDRAYAAMVDFKKSIDPEFLERLKTE